MTGAPTPCFGVVTVNWHGLDDSKGCVDSLLAAGPGPARVIVVDNGSADGSADALARWINERRDPRVMLLRQPANRGFAAGSNAGLVRLAADPAMTHFLLLNNDATVEPGFFAALTDALRRVPQAGIMGVTIYAGPGRERVWYAGGRLPGVGAVATHLVRVPDADGPVPTEFVTGCTFLIARRTWETLGPLPECYFMYFEDAEYCRRARDAGLAIVYAPRAVAHHTVGGAMGRDGARPQAAYRFSRARGLYARRNLTGWTRWGALAGLALGQPARALLWSVRGRVREAGALVRGVAAGLVA